jgi:hypothetical protein
VIQDEVTGTEETGPVETLPAGFALQQNYPNPFNSLTRIPLSVPAGHHPEPSLVIYNVRGQTVRHLPLPLMENGGGVATWDGRDDSGREVASGLYLCRLQLGPVDRMRKMVLIR